MHLFSLLAQLDYPAEVDWAPYLAKKVHPCLHMIYAYARIKVRFPYEGCPPDLTLLKMGNLTR